MTNIGRRLRAFLCNLSIIINRAFGGLPGETLCARIATKHGTDCLFCRLVGLLMFEPDHCERQTLE